MGMSRRQYAAHRGVSHTAVSKAVRTGRISVLEDGTIDPEQADREWAAQTDPSKQRGEHAQALAAQTAASTSRASAAAPEAERKPVSRAALDAVNETLRDAGGAGAAGQVGAAPGADDDAAGEAEPGAGGGGEVSFLRARMANEVIKAQTAKVKLAKMKEELVDRSRATALVFDLARRERDAWLNWAPRVAANMAAELDVDPHRMEQVLDKYLREHLAEMAEVKIDLR